MFRMQSKGHLWEVGYHVEYRNDKKGAPLCGNSCGSMESFSQSM